MLDLVRKENRTLLARFAYADWRSKRRPLQQPDSEVMEARRRAALASASEIYLSVLNRGACLLYTSRCV